MRSPQKRPPAADGSGFSPTRLAKWLTLGAALAALLSVPRLVSAQDQYAIDWFTLNGGGSASNGGAYTLSGTIGQPDGCLSRP